MIYYLGLFGIAVFAVSATLLARQRKLDVFGAIVVSLVTALGGGTFRDLVLGVTPVFWVVDPNYVEVAAITSILTFFLSRFYAFPFRALLVADALGLALFTVSGAKLALDHGVDPIIAVIMGVMTGVLGGMIRDVLSGHVPLILRKEIYATASISGAVLYVYLPNVLSNDVLIVTVSILATLLMRLAAIRYGFFLPAVFISSVCESEKGKGNDK